MHVARVEHTVACSHGRGNQPGCQKSIALQCFFTQFLRSPGTRSLARIFRPGRRPGCAGVHKSPGWHPEIPAVLHGWVSRPDSHGHVNRAHHYMHIHTRERARAHTHSIHIWNAVLDFSDAIPFPPDAFYHHGVGRSEHYDAFYHYGLGRSKT